MSYSQSYNNEGSNGGGGCMLLLLAAAAFALLMSLGGDDTHTTTETRSGVLSGNQTEVLSRNQLNLFSDVWNCFGDNSCIITTEMITDITTSNEVMNVTGDRNTVSTGGTLRTCVNAENYGYDTYEQCREGYTEVQP